ncbi:MAG: hypothetical protein JSS50_04975 [Proteobacteria bacterium]|nr:hypothetical protein [Pseudomonadota bacterium]
MKQSWPGIFTAIGTAGLITSIVLGATGEGMIAIGSSNLPMALGLASTSLLVLSAIALASNHIADIKAQNLLGMLCITAACVGCGYLGTHLGIAPHLTSLGAPGAIAAEIGISFGLGTAAFFLGGKLAFEVGKAFGIKQTLFKQLICPAFSVVIFLIAPGLCVIASTMLPSTLVSIMSTAAADATQAAAMEVMIAVSIAALTPAIVGIIAILPDIFDQSCGKANQASLPLKSLSHGCPASK